MQNYIVPVMLQLFDKCLHIGIFPLEIFLILDILSRPF